MAEGLSFTRIKPRELRGLLYAAEVEKPLVVDVLPAEVFALRRLPGAVNACVYEVSFLASVAALVQDLSRPIVVYGASHESLDAATAAAKLVRGGYAKVLLLAGGIEAWLEDGFALEGPQAEDWAERKAAQDLCRVEDGRYQADGAASIIEWVGRNTAGKHFGRVSLSKGELTVEGGAWSGDFTIDLTSIEVLDIAEPSLAAMLVNHLLSEDFFLAAMFPTAAFRIHAAELRNHVPPGAPNYLLRGSLSLRGVRAEVDIPATAARGASETPGGRPELIIEAHFDLDRTRWGVIYGSGRFYEHLGMHLVHDPISLEFRVVLR